MTDSVIGLDASDKSKKITINKKDRFEQLYIIGSTRQGKSTLIENLVLEDIKNDLGVCLIDPHGDLVNNIISRMTKRLDQVVYIDLSDKTYVAPFNLFHCEDTTDDHAVENVVSAFLHILQSSFGISPDQHARMNQYFRHITTLLVYNQNHTMLDILQLLTDDVFMLQLVENVPDHWEKVFWKDFYAKYSKGMRRMEDISMISNKIEEFISPVMRPWFGDTKKTIHFRKLMDEKKIVFIKSNPEWETITKIVGNVVIAQLLDAAYSRRNIPLDKRKQMNVYVDEYAKFASEDFSKLFSEAAKYGLSMSITSQVLEQVDPVIKAVCNQAKNVAVFRVSPENGKELASVFDCSPQPGIPRYEPLRTPVLEPIQYMLNHGVHPLPVTRSFVSEYGAKLVEMAKAEEDYAQRSYPGSIHLPPPTFPARESLTALNYLLHQAMLIGREAGNPDDIPIPLGVIETLVRIFIHSESFPQEVRQYLSFESQYNQITSGQNIVVDDRPARMQALQDGIAHQESDQQSKLLSLQQAVQAAEKDLDQAYRRAFPPELAAIRKKFLIVKYKGKYINAFPIAEPIGGYKWIEQYGLAPNSLGFTMFGDKKYNEKERCEEASYAYNQRTSHSNRTDHCYQFSTWEGAVRFYLRQNVPPASIHYLYTDRNRIIMVNNRPVVDSGYWFQIDEATLFDQRYWIQTTRQVVKYVAPIPYWEPIHNKGKGSDPSVLLLEAWEPMPGIERFWYTDQILKIAIAERIKQVKSNFKNLSFYDYYEAHSATIKLSDLLKEVEETQHGVETEIEKKIRKEKEELALLSQLQTYKEHYDNLVSDFKTKIREMMREIAIARVEDHSGLMQEVPTEIPTPEVEARIANQLKQLPKYTARVRVASGEYTITTIKPEGQIGNNELKKRIVEIQERNRESGYLRLRDEVKEEIKKRYEPVSPPTPQVGLKNNPPVQKPQQVAVPVATQAAPIPRKRAIATPVGKQCPSCGVQNSPTANFCQGCGTKLP